ncbi:MAG: polyprenyl diphosphate synthase, partial [Chloroflexota bacterium]
MNIFDDVFERELAELKREGAQLRHIGRMEGIPKKMQAKMIAGIESTKDNQKLVLNVAFNYGGRDEIVHAVQQMVENGVTADEINEEMISDYLFTKDSPDPDLVVRTSGEMRISNFLIWQAAYAEWVFPETYWPDFGRDELLAAIQEYANRERRFGLVASK